MKKIVFATNNINKVKEFKSLFNNKDLEFLTLKEINYDKEIIEDGTTFEENALIKARQVSRDLNCIAISDDSGLEVRALNYEPGIYSARYAGTHNDEDNNNLLIKNLKGIKDRYARYVCAICVYFPNGLYLISKEICEGEIIDERKGTNGFGYDPYFYFKEFKKTFAEIPLETKNLVSHRAKAIRKLRGMLDEDFNIIR